LHQMIRAWAASGLAHVSDIASGCALASRARTGWKSMNVDAI
jgi:hypothetical protein